MKKYFLGLMAVIAGLSACNESAVELTPQIQGDGVYATIEQPASPAQTKSLNWSSDNSLKFTWASGENVVVFGDGDAALLRSKTAGETSTKLESKGFDLKTGVNYYAFIPSSTFNIDAEATKVPVTFLGQRQTANGNTEHLKNYDYACASATVEEGNSLSFNLKNQVAWIVLQHSCKEALNNVMSITFSVPDKVFIYEGKYNVTGSKYYTSRKTNSLTLELGDEGGDGISFVEGELLRTFLTISPVDLTGKKLIITANLKDGSAVELFNATLESANITCNTPAVITTAGTADVKSVASVNGAEYSSLQGAINSAVSGTAGVTITLLDDVEGEFEVNDLRSNYRGDLLTTKIELNGHTIVSSSNSKAAVTLERGKLFLMNGNIKSENFVGTKLGSTATKAYLYLTNCNVESVQGAVCTGRAVNSKIIINGGTFSATNNAVIAGNGSNREGRNTISLNAYEGKAPVINASVVEPDAVACGIYAPWKDLITIKAAEINVENGVGILSRGGQITIEDAVIKTTGGDRTGKVADGGTQVPCKTLYLDEACEYPALPEAYIRVKGGKYSDNAGDAYMYDAGYGLSLNPESGLYEVVSNETAFVNAYEAAVEGSTIAVDKYVSLNSSSLIIKKNCAFDLAENSVITGSSSVATVLNFCEEGIENAILGKGSIVGPSSSETWNQAVWVNADGMTLTIGGDVNVKGGSAASMASAIDVFAGKLVINGGYFVSGTDKEQNNSPVIYLDPAEKRTAELEINGGVFQSVSGNAKYLINCQDDCISRCKISIKGGTFVGWNPAESNADIIDGKPANWVAEGYVSTETTYNGKKAWVVTKQ